VLACLAFERARASDSESEAARHIERALMGGSLGEDEPARRIAAEDLERARRWGAASGIGIALRAAALVGNGTASIDRLSEAANLLRTSPAKLEYARTLVELGAAQRRANSRAQARNALIFGNPKGGTPVMVATPTAALDLPLKALAWEDENGKVCG